MNLTGTHLAHLTSSNYRPRTIRARRYILSRFERTQIDLDQATRGDVEVFLGTYPDPQTRATYLGHLRSFFRWAVLSEHLASDPTIAITRPRIPRRVPRPLTDEQVTALLAAADDRMRAWLTLSIYVGLRACEIAPICGEDVHDGWLYIPVQKGGDAATAPLSPMVHAELCRWPSRGRLWNVTDATITTTASALFTELGIDGGLHRGRHTFGTRFLAASGYDLRATAEAMRHRSMNSTMAYTQVSGGRLAQIAAKM
jgi:integrase